MRLWHYDLLEYLPDRQFKGQLRELVLILKQRRGEGTNHLLINKVMDYDVMDIYSYGLHYSILYIKRYGKTPHSLLDELHYYLLKYGDRPISINVFRGWHNKEYLRVCMANLYEKYKFGKGKSKLTDDEWVKLCNGYREINGGEKYKI